MTGVLERLERGGRIERRPDAADRRPVRIPPQGRADSGRIQGPSGRYRQPRRRGRRRQKG